MESCWWRSQEILRCFPFLSSGVSSLTSDQVRLPVKKKTRSVLTNHSGAKLKAILTWRLRDVWHKARLHVFPRRATVVYFASLAPYATSDWFIEILPFCCDWPDFITWIGFVWASCKKNYIWQVCLFLLSLFFKSAASANSRVASFNREKKLFFRLFRVKW